MPVTPATSATLAASIFFKFFSRQESNEIGLWLVGEPRWVFPGMGIGIHFVIFQEFGKAPNFRRLLNWSARVCLYTLARAFITMYDTWLAPTAEFILLLRITSSTVSTETASYVSITSCVRVGRKPSGIGCGSTRFAGKNEALRASHFPCNVLLSCMCGIVLLFFLYVHYS